MAKSLDVMAAEQKEALQSVAADIRSGDGDAMAQHFIEWANSLQQQMIAEAHQVTDMYDQTVLAERGLRRMTTDENDFYQAFITAAKSTNPQQALTNLDIALPKTTIDMVFEDIQAKHELLSVIDFQNTSGVTEWLISSGDRPMATWSNLCAEIVTELSRGLELVDLSMAKLSAFIPVCKAMLDLGPVWIDRYVRAVLSEGIAFGLENGILNGKGKQTDKNEPVGMTMDITKPIDPATGYTKQTPTAITSFDPQSYGKLIAKLAINQFGESRVIQNLFMVVNPVDYCNKVGPATTVLGTNGLYVNNVLPYPTQVIQSALLQEGEAVIGLGGKYFMGLGLPQSGTIEYSDEFRFLEDQRVYKTKLYGNGRPKDAASHILLDISKLKPTYPTVKTIADAPGV